MTLRDMLIIRELLKKVVVRGDEMEELLRVVDKIDSLLASHNAQPAA